MDEIAQIEDLQLKVNLMLIKLQGLELFVAKIMYPDKSIPELKDEIDKKYEGI